MHYSRDYIASLAPQIPTQWVKGEKISEKVYLVQDPRYPQDKKFIVKEINTREAKKDASSNIREFEILRKVNHFRIVRFYGSIQEREKLSIFLEFLQKGSLHNYIIQTYEHGLDIDEVRIFTRQILEGVSYLHNFKPQILHRDIRSENILLKDDRNIKLTGFALSKMISDSNHTAGVGTFNWMAPEVISSHGGSCYDFKADIWSTGVTVVELATERPKRTADQLLAHMFMKEIQLLPMALQGEIHKVRLIGSGSFGKVYLAKDAQGKLLALKEMTMFAADREIIMESFRSEFKIMSKVEHPRIVSFYGFNEADNILSIYMEYVPMGSLEDYIDSGKKVSEEQARLFTRQILEGVNYLHENKIIHRDINGNHVLIEDEHSVKVGGSGVSKVIRPDPDANSLLQEKHEIGCVSTMHWMAPELIKYLMGSEGAYDSKADIWSVGCTVVQMITGRPPFKDLSKHQHLYRLVKMKPGEYPDFQLPQGLRSVDLENFLRKTMENDPLIRPSAEDLLKDDDFLKNKI
ncbi:Mitogen-activated protein kinase kinase kinase 5 [Bulinus truncatus]|nr:Mitogen-activated protein kinase kinase kinase 5 [Bulinus truncatus]